MKRPNELKMSCSLEEDSDYSTYVVILWIVSIRGGKEEEYGE